VLHVCTNGPSLMDDELEVVMSSSDQIYKKFLKVLEIGCGNESSC